MIGDEHVTGREGFQTDLADMNTASWPGLVARLYQQRKVAEVAVTVDKYAQWCRLTAFLNARIRELYDGLAKAGFKTNLGPYNAGLVPLVFGRSGGYHLDTRTGKHVINGDIKLKQGSSIEGSTEKGVKFADGMELEANVVVLATGYASALFIYSPP
ncbi:hypothetical protein J3R83DRAFT_4281 [Lanmaoa asiatica]|nr:hypothetical protein J3R83DRAFT_4281 [Lanmaoa asiatica]